MQHTYKQNRRERSPMRRPRQYRPQARSQPAAYDAREKDYNMNQTFRGAYENTRRPQNSPEQERYRPRREPLAQRKRAIQRPGPSTNNSQGQVRKTLNKRARIARKNPVKKAVTKDDLDMELDKYMGNEAFKGRLDEQLANYFAEDGNEGEQKS
uniref:Chromatin target of PRMT1 protein C-terminal domain-containing protein n=1 Tax=Babesia bovis TaxID=5865 RepID=S6BLF0_BABBO|nr:conserved hypothetical protein [Babesia bovis]